MTAITQFHSESLPPTPSLDLTAVVKHGEEAVTSTDRVPCKLIVFPVPLQEDHIPDGFIAIDALVAQHEQDGERKARLAAARKRLSEDFYGSVPNLAALRLRQGLSQAALAACIGTSQSHIARLEKGTDDPRFSTVERLADALHTDLETIARAMRAN